MLMIIVSYFLSFISDIKQTQGILTLTNCHWAIPDTFNTGHLNPELLSWMGTFPLFPNFTQMYIVSYLSSLADWRTLLSSPSFLLRKHTLHTPWFSIALLLICYLWLTYCLFMYSTLSDSLQFTFFFYQNMYIFVGICYGYFDASFVYTVAYFQS